MVEDHEEEEDRLVDDVEEDRLVDDVEEDRLVDDVEEDRLVDAHFDFVLDRDLEDIDERQEEVLEQVLADCSAVDTAAAGVS